MAILENNSYYLCLTGVCILTLISTEPKLITKYFQICAKGFNRAQNLQRHLLVHKSAEERILYGCVEPNCTSSFSQKVNLRLHMQRKHGKGLTDFKTLTAEESGKDHFKRDYKEKGEPQKITNWATEGKILVRYLPLFTKRSKL